MNFDLSQDQKLLVDAAASFAKKQSPVSRLRAMRQDPIGWSKSVWKQMGELGWLGILLPEALGGFGGRFQDAALVLEKLGTTLVPEPYIPSVVLAGSTILALGSEEQKARWLQPMAAGDASLALAYAERESRFDAASVGTTATASGKGYRLSGEKTFVLNGHAADALVVTARTSGERGDAVGVSAFVVDRSAPGLRIRPIQTMDGHHAAMVSLQDVEVDASRRLGPEGAAAAAIARALDLGAAAACAEGVGVMQTVLAMTRDYLCTREQFGVKIGTFQVLQHRCVDMFIETELARSASLKASICADDADEAERMAAVSAAKVQLATSGKFVTQQAIQLHGGIGVTDEHDVGLYFKRMHVLNTLFGDEEHHLARFASLPTFRQALRADPEG
jgi:alkylation response protein AidB-like acyl-CoA dehydrogenase